MYRNYNKIEIEKVFSNDSALIPAIIQDDITLKVLMLGYMNKESFNETISNGKVTFYSRSRKCLWTKGESSSNYLFLKSIEADCDNDTLLIRVDPAGAVCHNGTKSCFNNDAEGFIGRLQQIVSDRRKLMPENSYTTMLFNSGAGKIAKKLGEEAVEVVIEAVKGDKEQMIYEAGDLIYHLLVLLEYYNLSIKDIEEELVLRHKK